MANVNLFSGGSILNNLLPKIKIRYPQNYVEISSAGHVFERNNTKEGERFRMIHALGNTLIWMRNRTQTSFLTMI